MKKIRIENKEVLTVLIGRIGTDRAVAINDKADGRKISLVWDQDAEDRLQGVKFISDDGAVEVYHL